MTEREDGNEQLLPAALTDAELRSLAYFGVGIGSEGGDSGRDVSHRLSFAGNVSNGVMTPVGNSGYSVGTLQTDLGQHPEAADTLVDAYQVWARTTHPDWTLTDAERTQTISDLGRNGRAIVAQNGRALDAAIKSRLDSFLASAEGVTYVHGRDVAQVNFLMRPAGGVDQLRQTTLYQNATADDQSRLATIVLKLENQGGSRYYSRIIDGINDGTINGVEDARTVVNGFLPNRGGRNRSGPDYLESGVSHALEATEVFNRLRSADPRSPLYLPWQNVLANPLVNPTQTDQDVDRPNLGSEYVTVKTLFLQKTSSPSFIEALDQGGSYGYSITNSRGQGRPQSTRLYAAGDDFVVMDGNGIGKAYVDGAWSDVNRTNLARADQRDGVVDLNINRGGTIERLLRIDPNAPILRPDRQPAIHPEMNIPAEDRQGMSQNQRRPGPFNDPMADRYFAAVMAGDSDLADRFAIEFAQSREGRQMAQLGDRLLAQQQALEQQQVQERQMERQGPVMQL